MNDAIHQPATKYRHLFFDLDHTLWDFELNSELTWRRLYDEFDLASRGITDFGALFAAYNIHNDKLWERFRNGFIKRDELRWKRVWLTLLDFKVSDPSLSHELSSAYLELLPSQTALMPNAREVLDHCKGRYSMHLITNGFEMTQWQKLQYSGIAGYFTEMITSEKSSSVKPQRAIFDFALQKTGAECAQCLMIGDAIDIDILGALNAGWDSVYFNPAGVAHSRKPTYEVNDLGELLTIL